MGIKISKVIKNVLALMKKMLQKYFIVVTCLSITHDLVKVLNLFNKLY